jgi:TorA maturation chaperone TorD
MLQNPPETPPWVSVYDDDSAANADKVGIQ